MKIVVIVPRFAITGVPLAQLRFAEALAGRGHRVTLVIGYIDSGYQAPPSDRVRIEVWNCPKARQMLRPLMSCLLKERPDVVFSAEDHLNTLVLLAAILTRSSARISGSSRVTPFDTYSNTPFTKRWLLKQIARSVMWRGNALTCVSQDMVEQYRQVFRNAPHQCVYNIVDSATARRRIQEHIDHPWVSSNDIPLLVAAGRLAPWKGFADLIQAVKLLTDRRPVRLLILGDGPLRGELQEQIEQLGLGDFVQLTGNVENPLKYFRRARVFVLSSLVEGMPNVLVEAMMCGCTPVSTNCPTGPRELLQDGKYGYLVPMCDPAAMAAAIERALEAPIPQNRLAEAVRPFEENTVIRRHFELLGVG